MRDLFAQEIPHEVCDVAAVGLEGKMPRALQDVELDALQITGVGFRSRHSENEVTLTPHDQGWGLVAFEIRVPLLVLVEVGRVVRMQGVLDSFPGLPDSSQQGIEYISDTPLAFRVASLSTLHQATSSGGSGMRCAGPHGILGE